ncbi:acetyl-CoA carboxylase biotin carboxyl carrier protein [Lactiplantibacillus modestisalitolerans]|uniref:Biotin carboxyl carrier protein of acetyl-CoA carboxylase n=1 Tax=Lactiplantibacillus modestisalitolerans TaxID=1457219 RepID=A0ABV5WV59_9LACO|nr:acetyl-CoA carboxylase biotin carboxyl carrier protein subunit [Lactiplantibacillus modestisalitolerans]
MEFDKIYELMSRFENSNLTSFSYHDQDFEIKLGKAESTPVAPAKTPANPQPVKLASPAAASAAPTSQVTLSRSQAAAQSEAPASAVVEPTSEATSTAPTPVSVDPKECVTAPVVGIYYQAHSSEESPYVQVGDHVSVGQQVGLIQAMQMMRPVVAKQAGYVKALLVRNGDEVNFGQPLIQLVPDTPDDI